MVSLLASSVVDHGLDPRSGQTKDYKIGICCFSVKRENKLIFNEMMMSSALYKTNTLSWIFIVLAHWNNSLRVDMSLHLDTLFWFRANQSALFPYHGENKWIFNEMMMSSARRLLFQWASPIKSQLNVLVLYKAELIIISLKINLFSPW
jgi:hypothetical protein